jgi:outer membrane protein assembly factor BamA
VLETGAGLQGDYAGYASLASWRNYVDLPNEQVLALRAELAFSNQDARPYSLGGSINTSVTTLNIAQTNTPLNQRRFALRGYNNGEPLLTGHDMALTTLEYRFPIARIERGWMAPPVGVHQVFGQVFMDAGRVGSSLQQAQTYTGIGLELGADIILFYTLPVRVQMGYAKGLDKNIGGNQAYLRIGSSF